MPAVPDIAFGGYLCIKMTVDELIAVLIEYNGDTLVCIADWAESCHYPKELRKREIAPVSLGTYRNQSGETVVGAYLRLGDD